MKTCATFSAVIVILMVDSAAAIILGQVDDFQDGTVMSWIEGPASPNQPTNAPDEGPLGLGDHAMFDLSSGTQGPGGRAAMLNRSQWTGDYLSAGVTQISAMVRASTSSAPLTIRMGFEGDGLSRYVTSTGISIPNDDQWYPVSFEIAASDLTQVEGMEDYMTVMSAVEEFRIFSSAATIWQGEVGFTEIYVDNITAVPEPTGCWFWVVFVGLVLRLKPEACRLTKKRSSRGLSRRP